MSKVWQTFIVGVQKQLVFNFSNLYFSFKPKTMAALWILLDIKHCTRFFLSSLSWIMLWMALWGLYYFLNFVPEETYAQIGELGSIKSTINAELRLICPQDCLTRHSLWFLICIRMKIHLHFQFWNVSRCI